MYANILIDRMNEEKRIAMETREERGLKIAATCKIEKNKLGYKVPSQSGNGSYIVSMDGNEPFCTCPDFEARHQPCKHIYAVEFMLKREEMPDGTTVVTQTMKVTCKQDWTNYNLAQTHEQDEPSLTMYADGCGALISKELFQKVGGFEESYFCYCEDYELSWKAWLLGYKVYFVPTAEFYHKVSSTLGGRSHAYIYLLWRNQLRNIIKFADSGSLMLMLPLFTAYAIAMCLVVYCIQERNFSLILPMAKAYGSIISDVPRLLRGRKEFQKNRKIRDKELRKLGLIMSFKNSIREALATLDRKSKFKEEAAG